MIKKISNKSKDVSIKSKLLIKLILNLTFHFRQIINVSHVRTVRNVLNVRTLISENAFNCYHIVYNKLAYHVTKTFKPEIKLQNKIK